MSGAEAQPILAQVWADLQKNDYYPYGGRRIFRRYTTDRIELGPEFDKLEPATRKAALALLRLGGVPMGKRQDALFGDPNAIHPMLPHGVYASDGRIISIPYDGCERMYFWTEYDRSRAQYLGRGLPPRRINYPLAIGTEKWVADILWRMVGKRQAEIIYIAWVPERGFFEITIANEARWRYQNRLNAFWWYAPRLYKYVVVTQDGVQLETHGGLGKLAPPVQR